MTGRPRVDINQKYFENLCGMFCTLEEIANFFGCSKRTIQNWCKNTYGKPFSKVYEEKSAKGKISLRQAQLKLAQKNAQMAMFLGRQYLGQDKDKSEPKITPVEVKKPEPETVLDMVKYRHRKEA